MPRAYSKTQCRHCPAQVSANGLARASHARKHVKEGILVGLTPALLPYEDQRVHYVTPQKARKMLTTESLCGWVVSEGTLTT